MNKSASSSDAPSIGDPFDLAQASAYRAWRDAKLRGYPTRAEQLVVPIDDPLSLTAAEVAQITRVCRKTNMVVYACQNPVADKEIPRTLGAHFGLRRLDSNLLADDDGISSLQDRPDKAGRGYIPYSNKRLLWHTDGYYNRPEAQIRAFVLHCVAPAAEGGENSLLDHEIAYILLRDADPEFVRTLMAPDAMTIPANTEEGAESRAAVTGPVFSVDPVSGDLHMRYTARTRSIVWKSDTVTRAAVQYLDALLNGDSPYVFRHTLSAGQGLMCNNVLHNRTAFRDDAARGVARLVYRARYYDRIRGTHWTDPTE